MVGRWQQTAWLQTLALLFTICESWQITSLIKYPSLNGGLENLTHKAFAEHTFSSSFSKYMVNDQHVPPSLTDPKMQTFVTHVKCDYKHVYLCPDSFGARIQLRR